MASVLKVDTIKSLTGNEAMTIDESGVPLLQVPAFRVYRNDTQSLPVATVTPLQYNAESFDTHNWFDFTNYRYVPKIPGYYLFAHNTYMTMTSGSTIALTFIDVNGTPWQTSYLPTTGIRYSVSGSLLMYMNGVDDYAGISVYANGTSPIVTNGETVNNFSGFLVRAA